MKQDEKIAVELNVPRKDTPVTKDDGGRIRELHNAIQHMCTDAELDSFWGELVGFWRVDGDGEVVTFKKGKVSYTLKCGWNEGTLVVAMIAPWAREWDYVQLYRGRFGWGSVGRGFCTMKERRKAAKLLLDEIIRRNQWMQENPGALAEGRREIEDAAKEAKIPLWFAEYSWVRNKMAKAGDGDMRLYVKGGDRIWGTPIQCEWAIADSGKDR